MVQGAILRAVVTRHDASVTVTLAYAGPVQLELLLRHALIANAEDNTWDTNPASSRPYPGITFSNWQLDPVLPTVSGHRVGVDGHDGTPAQVFEGGRGIHVVVDRSPLAVQL